VLSSINLRRPREPADQVQQSSSEVRRMKRAKRKAPVFYDCEASCGGGLPIEIVRTLSASRATVRKVHWVTSDPITRTPTPNVRPCRNSCRDCERCHTFWL
jgi:hypothetical protein